MFLPIGDEPNPHKRPLVTYILIAANVLVFLFVSLPLMSQLPDPRDPTLAEYLRLVTNRMPHLTMRQVLAETSAYDLFTFEHGFRPSAPALGDLFASLFLHGGWLHLIGNMLFLWIYGDNVEARLGHLRYLLVYLGTGVAATLFFTLFQLRSGLPLIGASGAISGVLGAYFWWFPHNRIRMLVVLFFFVDVWRVPARWVLAMYLLVDNLLPFLVGAGDGAGVAYGAHLGGFLAGLTTAVLVGRGADPKPKERPAPAQAWVLDREGEPIAAVTPLDSFRQTVARNRWEDAAELFARMSSAERAAQSDADIIALAVGLRDTGRPEAALAVLQHLISIRPTSPALAQAHYLAGRIHLQHTGRLLAARQHLLNVLDLSPAAALEGAARQALAATEEALGRRGSIEPS